MSAFKKIAGLVAGASAVGVIGVAVAQSVPPNPYVANAAIGAGEQTVNMTPIGETGVLAEAAPLVQQTATITRQEELAAAPAPVQDNSQVASASTTTEDNSQQVAQATPPQDNTQSLGASPAPSEDTNVQPAPRADRG